MKLFLGLLFVLIFCVSSSFSQDGVSRSRARPGAKAGEVRKHEGKEEIKLESSKPAASDSKVSKFNPEIYESLPRKVSSSSEFIAAPDRWKMIYQGKWYDPYNQNILKGDIPVFGEPGHEWFFEATILSDTLVEHRRLPTPVGISSTTGAGSTDVFGHFKQTMLVENLLTQFSLIRGNTVFKPPEYELRVAPVWNFNYVDVDETGFLYADPRRGTTRGDQHVGFQELFLDVHLADISDRYDFISSRVGIQRFNSDFRGFIYADDQPGARLFGTWDNNKWQYNLAHFSRLDKDTNAAINSTFDDRHEDVLILNLYRQDAFILGHNIQFSYLYREDTAGSEGQHYDLNGFLIRPASIGDERNKNLYTSYFGFNTDGHIGRVNTTTAFYYAHGSESHNPIARQGTDVSAFMTAAELSYDFDWLRVRGSFLWASGDSDPYDGDANGFDAIFDVPNFAGGDLAYWQRQGIPLIGGGGVALVSRNSLLPSLRPGKEEGQSNFVNPGLFLYNLGFDVEVTPEFKLINNATYLRFHHSDVLEVVRQDGSIDEEIGFDISSGFLYRPFLNNNVQIRGGVAMLIPGDGLKNLYGDKVLWDVFTNVIFLY